MRQGNRRYKLTPLPNNPASKVPPLLLQGNEGVTATSYYHLLHVLPSCADRTGAPSSEPPPYFRHHPEFFPAAEDINSQKYEH